MDRITGLQGITFQPAWRTWQILLVKRALSQILAFVHWVIFQCPICEAGIKIFLDTDLFGHAEVKEAFKI